MFFVLIKLKAVYVQAASSNNTHFQKPNNNQLHYLIILFPTNCLLMCFAKHDNVLTIFLFNFRLISKPNTQYSLIGMTHSHAMKT